MVVPSLFTAIALFLFLLAPVLLAFRLAAVARRFLRLVRSGQAFLALVVDRHVAIALLSIVVVATRAIVVEQPLAIVGVPAVGLPVPVVPADVFITILPVAMRPV